LLLLACAAVLEATFLIRQLSASVEDLHAETARAISNADRTLAIIRETTEQQRGSYEQIARGSAESLANLARLIQRTDERLDKLMPAAEALLTNSAAAAEALSRQTEDIGRETSELVRASRAAIESVERAYKDPALEEAAASLARSTANVERMSAAAAESSERIRDMLSPTKKSFWRRLLELMIPRPTVRVGR
jgi:hypothetical protein